MSPWTPQPTGLTPLCLDASRPCALAHPFPPLPRPAPGVLLLGVLPSPHPNPPGAECAHCSRLCPRGYSRAHLGWGMACAGVSELRARQGQAPGVTPRTLL